MTDLSVADAVRLAANSTHLTYWDGEKWPAVLWVTIASVRRGAVPQPGKSSKKKMPVIYFDGIEKPLACGSYNVKFLRAVFGGRTVADWKKRRLGLYQDPDIKYAGERVGGIRFTTDGKKHSSEANSPEDAADKLGKAWPPPKPGQAAKRAAEPPMHELFANVPNWPDVNSWKDRPVADAPAEVQRTYLGILVGLQPPKGEERVHEARLAYLDKLLKGAGK